jgi:hypothetical protein
MTETRTPLFNVEVFDDDDKKYLRLAVDFYDRDSADKCVMAWYAGKRFARVVDYYPPIKTWENV